MGLVEIFIIWVIGFGAISLRAKEIAARVMANSKLPRFLNYLVVATPFIIIEEYLTCETPFFDCIRGTLIVFYFLFAALYLLQKYLRLNWKRACVVFAAMGWIVEFIIVGRIYSLNAIELAIISPLAMLIYAVLAIVPSYYNEFSRNK